MRADVCSPWWCPPAARGRMPNTAGMEAVALLARLEGIMLDPVYTGKAIAGLNDGVKTTRFTGSGPVMFVHTGSGPALFAYYPRV